MFEEIEVVDAVTYRDNGCLEVRRANIIKKDGVEIARAYHRHVVATGADVSNEAPTVQAIAAALWTPELIAAYQATVTQE